MLHSSNPQSSIQEHTLQPILVVGLSTQLLRYRDFHRKCNALRNRLLRGYAGSTLKKAYNNESLIFESLNPKKQDKKVITQYTKCSATPGGAA